jgi:glycosyltransferase involved in cell wall biosynthesis
VRLACSTGGALEGEAAELGIPVRAMGSEIVKRRDSGRFAAFIAAELAREPTDVVHTHSFASALAASRVAGDGGCAFVLTEHSEGAWRRPEDDAALARALRTADATIAVSWAIKERLHTAGLPVGSMRVVPNAVLLAPAGRRNPRRGRQTVGVLARLRPEKGIDVFVRAAALVAALVPGVDFVVIGDGPERGSLERLGAEVGIVPGRLAFLGARPDGPSALRDLDVLAVPSVANEGTPLVVLEAFAAGVPLVASRTGGIPEQVRDRIDGLLVEPGDVAALAAALVEVLRDPAEARRRAAVARAEARERFPIEAMIDSVERVYEACLCGRGVAPLAGSAPTRARRLASAS